MNKNNLREGEFDMKNYFNGVVHVRKHGNIKDYKGLPVFSREKIQSLPIGYVNEIEETDNSFVLNIILFHHDLQFSDGKVTAIYL